VDYLGLLECATATAAAAVAAPWLVVAQALQRVSQCDAYICGLRDDVNTLTGHGVRTVWPAMRHWLSDFPGLTSGDQEVSSYASMRVDVPCL
jgi:hypothetical protein